MQCTDTVHLLALATGGAILHGRPGGTQGRVYRH
jgi:hypothetical protein